jgi:hypothetical protein
MVNGYLAPGLNVSIWFVGSAFLPGCLHLLHPEQVLFRCFDLGFVSTSSGMAAGAASHGQVRDVSVVQRKANKHALETVERFQG